MMKTILHLDGLKHWTPLSKGKILCKNVRLTNFGDIYPFVTVFPDAENVFIDSCNKNFVYYWADKSTFPNAKNLYLKSHPCESIVFRRKFESINVHEAYRRYVERWGGSNAHVVSDEEYDKLINSFTEIPYDFETDKE